MLYLNTTTRRREEKYLRVLRNLRSKCRIFAG
jgi:hypothetical protein